MDIKTLKDNFCLIGNLIIYTSINCCTNWIWYIAKSCVSNKV